MAYQKRSGRGSFYMIDCFLCSKPGVGWSLDSLRFIQGLKLCGDHAIKVKDEIEKRMADYLNTTEKYVDRPAVEREPGSDDE